MGRGLFARGIITGNKGPDNKNKGAQRVEITENFLFQGDVRFVL